MSYEKREREAARDAFERGQFSVTLNAVDPRGGQPLKEEAREIAAYYLCAMLGFRTDAALTLCERVAHVGRETVLRDVSLDAAIRVKEDLGALGAKAEIQEALGDQGGARQPIPQRVRNEVWRRDEGRCVDCGSRERLEFDHIIPVSKGGANTARNLDLRCEECNRRKAATI